MTLVFILFLFKTKYQYITLTRYGYAEHISHIVEVSQIIN